MTVFTLFAIVFSPFVLIVAFVGWQTALNMRAYARPRTQETTVRSPEDAR